MSKRGPCAKSRKTVFKTTLQGQEAITFLELLIVIVVIGILLGISLPHFRHTFSSLQLQSFTRQFQGFINYLRERAIVEGKIIYLNIDNDAKKYWGQIKDAPDRLKTYVIPEYLTIEADKKEVIFYPDGQIDKVTFTIVNTDNQNITLTTKGVYGGIKMLAQ